MYKSDRNIGKRVFTAAPWIYLDRDNKITAPRGAVRAWYNQAEGFVTVEINIDGEKMWHEIKISK